MSVSSGSMILHCSVAVLLQLMCSKMAEGFASGPPLSSCFDMLPDSQMGPLGLEGHTAVPQNVWPTYGRTKHPPYTIQIHREYIHYLPGDRITVSIVADQTTGHNVFTGILLQARKVICADNVTVQDDGQLYGMFYLPTPEKTLLKTMDCLGLEGSALGQKSQQWKINETMSWQAPDESVGNLIFKATIVQEEEIYWTDVFSAIIRDPTVPEPLPCSTPPLTLSTILLLSALFVRELFH